MIVTIEQNAKNFQALYLLVGAGVIIAFLLIIIVMQIYKNWKISKRKTVVDQVHSEHSPQNETTFQGDRRHLNVVSDECNQSQIYQPLEVEYLEIIDEKEMNMPHTYSAEQLPQMESHNSVVNRNDDTESYKPRQQDSILIVSISDPYLTPI